MTVALERQDTRERTGAIVAAKVMSGVQVGHNCHMEEVALRKSRRRSG